MDPFSLGVVLVTLGGIIYLSTRWLIRAEPINQPVIQTRFTPFSTYDDSIASPEKRDAILFIQPGGRLISLNFSARKMLGVNFNETPSLEAVARKIRPTDVFLRLSANEGKAPAFVEGRMIEISSTLVPIHPLSLMMVTLHQMDKNETLQVASKSNSPALVQAIEGLANLFGKSNDLPALIQSILEQIEIAIPADLFEFNLWEEELKHLRPYRLISLVGEGKRLDMPEKTYRKGEGYSGWIIEQGSPLFIANTAKSNIFRPIIDKYTATIKSYLGVPLKIGDRFLGTIEIGSNTSNTFEQDDLDTLLILSRQVIALLQTYEFRQAETRNSAELSQVYKLIQEIGKLRDPQSLYTQLLKILTNLFPVEIAGFLIYEEPKRRLTGISPFHGLPPQFLDIYNTTIYPNSQAEKLLLGQDTLIAINASEDLAWEAFGIKHLAQAASIHETVLAPLISSGRILGYFQISNRKDGKNSFSSKELTLLTLVTRQMAPVIENFTLYEQNRQRAQRSETLRRIASLASSSVAAHEIFNMALRDLAHVLKADFGIVYLLEKNLGLLSYQPFSHTGTLTGTPDRFPNLPIDDVQYPFSITGSQHTILTGSISEEDTLIPFYRESLTEWKIESAILVPLVVQDKGVGEIWFGSTLPGRFDQLDLQAVLTASNQLAWVIEQSHLSSQTDDRLRQRVEQLTALTRLSLELSGSNDIHFLLQNIFDQAVQLTRADGGLAIIFDQYISGVYETPYTARRYHVGLSLPESLPKVLLEYIENPNPQVLTYTEKPELKALDDRIRSALLVPVRPRGKNAGLIFLYSQAEGLFNQPEIELGQSLAIQMVASLLSIQKRDEEKKQTGELSQNLLRAEILLHITRNVRPNRPLHESLDMVCNAIQEITPYQTAIISLFDPVTETLRKISQTGISAEVWQELTAQTQPWKPFQQVFISKYQRGSGFFIPAGVTKKLSPEIPRMGLHSQAKTKDSTRPAAEDLLLFPFYGNNNTPLGILSLDLPRDGLSPSQESIDTLGLFSEIISWLIENFRYNQALSTNLSEWETKYARLEQATEKTRQQIVMFLQKDLDQSLAIHTLSRQLEQNQAIPDIIEAANHQTDINSSLLTLCTEILSRFPISSALIARMTGPEEKLIRWLGRIPEVINPETLFGQKNPLRQILHEENTLIVENIDNDEEWSSSPILNALGAKGFICLPFKIGNENHAGILLISETPLVPLTKTECQLYSQMSRQVSIGLQNIRLLTETRQRIQELDLLLDFNRELSSFEPDNILNALLLNVLKTMPAARAGWLGTWDEQSLRLIPKIAHGYSENTSLLEITFSQEMDLAEEDLALPLRVIHSGNPLRVNEVQFMQDYKLSSRDFLNYRKATAGRIPVSSLVVPLKRSGEILGVLVLDNFNLSAAFTDQDEALANSLAQQTALALENAQLFMAAKLRASQLQALNQAAVNLNSYTKHQDLLANLLDLVKDILPSSTATLWMHNEDKLTITSASGFADDEDRIGLNVSIDDSGLFKEMLNTNKPVLVNDIRQDSRFFPFHESQNLSWLGVPLIAKSQLIGILAFEKEEAGFYTSEHLFIITTFASQAAVALENAQLFEESQQRANDLDNRSQRLAILNQLSSELSSSMDVSYILNLAAKHIVEILNISRVAGVMIDDRQQSILTIEEPPRSLSLPQIIKENPILQRLRETQGIYVTKDPDNDPELKELLQGFVSPDTVCSVLIIPMVTDKFLHGWFLLQDFQTRHFSAAEIELARTIGNQTAIAIQNARLLAETRVLTFELERRVEERTLELQEEHRNTQTLLEIIMELSASQDLEGVLERSLDILRAALGADGAALLLLDGTTHLYQAGKNFVKTAAERLFSIMPEQEISSHILQERNSIIINNIVEDTRWSFSKDLELEYRSLIGIPLIVGDLLWGTLFLFHQKPAFFHPRQLGLAEAAARQIGVTINNAQLSDITNSQSDQLMDMLREQQIEASRSRAILEAVADGVLVTNANNQITLFNLSAERILDLKSEQVMGNSLDKFIGLFGKAAQTWTATIHKWSKNTSSYESGETYAEQINLDNGNVVQVHLAPVILGENFLGTVSIFRDITREVQVDRLKSEFVANVSHELRTPMTSIKGYAELMLMGATGAINEQQTKFLQIIKSNTQRLQILVNDLLDVSRIESGRITLNIRPLHLDEIAKDVIAECSRRSSDENRPMNFSLEAPADLPEVSGDPERVRQIFNNLVNNGYNYTPDNGRVTIQIIPLESEVQVNVQDTGIGISPENKPRIFERFYRGDDPLVLASAGTGLGLAISKILVERHGGRIWFESEGIKGKGSTFSFSLPLNRE